MGFIMQMQLHIVLFVQEKFPVWDNKVYSYLTLKKLDSVSLTRKWSALNLHSFKWPAGGASSGNQKSCCYIEVYGETTLSTLSQWH